MGLTIRRVGLFVLALTLTSLGAGLLSGCDKTKNDAATVDGKAITKKALDAEVAKLKLQSPALFDKNSGGMDEGTIRSTLLDELISQQLMNDEAKKQNIKVTDAEIENNLKMLKAGYSDEKQFEAALKTAGYTLDTLKDQIKWQLLSTKLLEKLVPASSVNDREAKAYYDANKSSYKVTAAKRVSHILFASDDEDSAKKVLAELQNGADFAAMAKKYSTDTASARNGGDLGWPTQAYVQEFQDAVDKLKKGEMSGLVKSAYGWHIIKVTDERQAGTQTFEEAKDSIKQTLLSAKRSDRYKTLLSDLKKDADIVIYDKAVKAAQAKTGGTTTTNSSSTKSNATQSNASKKSNSKSNAEQKVVPNKMVGQDNNGDNNNQ